MNVIDRNVIERPRLASSEMDLIFIEGFQGDTVIGIDPDELTSLQPVQIDLWAGVPHSHACDTDRIGEVQTRQGRAYRELRIVCRRCAVRAEQGFECMRERRA